MAEKGKSTDGLMRHIRNCHSVEIGGSSEKQKLLNMGYYHGYKASRFVKNRSNLQNFDNFEEVSSIYDFDLEVKSIFYPMIIKIETSMKNRLIDYLVSNNATDIEDIYQNKLNDYQAKKPGSSDYSKYLKKKLVLREKIDGSISYYYGKKHPAIQHFFHLGKPLPIWALFEVITFGEFGNFISCMNKAYRIDYTESMGMHHSGFNQNGRTAENIVFSLSGLRNATMHNSMIFDCRFNDSNISNQLKSYLTNVTNVSGIKFESIVDFLVLLTYLLRKQNSTKRELNKSVRLFDEARENLFLSIPKNSYDEILGSDAKTKINCLKDYIKNS